MRRPGANGQSMPYSADQASRRKRLGNASVAAVRIHGIAGNKENGKPAVHFQDAIGQFQSGEFRHDHIRQEHRDIRLVLLINGKSLDPVGGCEDRISRFFETSLDKPADNAIVIHQQNRSRIFVHTQPPSFAPAKVFWKTDDMKVTVEYAVV
jgi:hypothetical protein